MKMLICTFLIFCLFILNGCGGESEKSVCNEPYFEHKQGECCLDSNNNSICDEDEIIEEKSEEQIGMTEEKSEEKAGVSEETKGRRAVLKLYGLLVYYLPSTKEREFDVRDISYRVTNLQDNLTGLKMKVEIHNHGKGMLASKTIPVFKDMIIKKGESLSERSFLNLKAQLDVLGGHKVPITVKVSLYQDDTLLEESVWDYEILSDSDKNNVKVADSDSAFSFDYKRVPLRYSKDSKIDFQIRRVSEDYVDYTIKAVVSNETVEESFMLDYYCENINGVPSFLIMDYDSYLEDLYNHRMIEETYKAVPSIIIPYETVERRMPKLDCNNHVLIIRKGVENYVRNG